MTLHKLKPRFQSALRPAVAWLADRRVAPNHVTLLAAGGSVAVGGIVFVAADLRWPFLLIPAWSFVRMALNAIDGMLAREFNQQSPLGAYLNELCDIVSDAALFLPFALVAPFDLVWVAAILLLILLSEFAGVLGPMIGAARRFDGPLGKSDRAAIFSGLALAVGLTSSLPAAAFWVMPCLTVLLLLTVFNRIRSGLHQQAERRQPLRQIPNFHSVQSKTGEN